ncbi:hypothetical protein WOLCODRAFT_17834 [Wolfiporia cocos MD-104 SS10]|uniref:Uncharacterized protein n=1 Tax=Wolfiporia cocos (strain MD-104) TaxID=742152 RepID=A0A2H3JK83_WOLCO|nr:hypothetical protein WOLCODRAFT_17834 [Wolfiporia cocos MD-104 SS10]
MRVVSARLSGQFPGDIPNIDDVPLSIEADALPRRYITHPLKHPVLAVGARPQVRIVSQLRRISSCAARACAPDRDADVRIARDVYDAMRVGAWDTHEVSVLVREARLGIYQPELRRKMHLKPSLCYYLHKNAHRPGEELKHCITVRIYEREMPSHDRDGGGGGAVPRIDVPLLVQALPG